jgi:hypothetical protein
MTEDLEGDASVHATAVPAMTAVAPAAAAAVPSAAVSATPVGPLTLAIDIGGTGLKASVLDAQVPWWPTGSS